MTPCVKGASFTINGAEDEAQQLNASGETGLVNSGGSLSVMGGSTNAVTMSATNTTLTNAGSIVKPSGNTDVVRISSGNTTIVNSGTLSHNSGNSQHTDARAIRSTNTALSGISITNNAGATIHAAQADAIQIRGGSTVTVINEGTISSGNDGQALDFASTVNSTVTNQATGIIRTSATASDAIRIGTGGKIDNYGLIESLDVGDDGRHAISYKNDNGPQTGVEIIVRGTGKVYGGKHGITGDAASLITVEQGGELIGRHGSGINIDSDNANGTGTPIVDNNYFTVTVVNSGLISGDYNATAGGTGDGDGIDVDELVHITNNGTGIIRGTGADGNDNGGMANNTEGIAAGGGTVINYGSIYAENLTGNSTRKARGIVMDNGSDAAALAATFITNHTGGSIEGKNGAAILLRGNFADQIDNREGAAIYGSANEAAVAMGGGDDTFTNAGRVEHRVTGGTAIDLGDGTDTLILTGAAVVVGHMDGGAGTDALTIATTAPFRYQGEIRNFEDAKVQEGKGLEVGAAASEAGAVTLSGTNLTLEEGSTLGFDLFSPVSYDELVVGVGSALDVSDAQLLVLLGDGFTADVGDEFLLISGFGMTGSFSGLGEGATFTKGAYLFEAHYLGDAGAQNFALRVAEIVPEPSRVLLLLMGFTPLLARRRR